MKVIEIDARRLPCPQPVVRTRQALSGQDADRVEVLVDNQAAVENVSRYARYAGCRVEEPMIIEGGVLVVIVPPVRGEESGVSDTGDPPGSGTGRLGSGSGSAPGNEPDREGKAGDRGAAGGSGTGPDGGLRGGFGGSLPGTEDDCRADAADAEVSPAVAAPADLAQGGGGSSVRTLLVGRDVLGEGDRKLGRLLIGAFLYTLTEMDYRPERLILMNSGVRLAAGESRELGDLRRLEAEGVEILVCGTCLDYYQLKEFLSVGRISNMYDIAEHLMQGNVLVL